MIDTDLQNLITTVGLVSFAVFVVGFTVGEVIGEKAGRRALACETICDDTRARVTGGVCMCPATPVQEATP